MKFLISRQVVREQAFIEGPIGVRHKSPGHAVDAWQTHQRFVAQDRQVQKKAPRQAVVNFFDLRLDQMKVV